MIDIAKSKAKLESKLRELTARVEQIDEELDEPGDDDWQERAVELSADEVLEEVADVTMEEIAQIKLALLQIKQRRYGICSSCGNAITDARMKILPYATMCIECA